MKRILSFLIAFVLALTVNSYATQRTATFGDKNASGEYRIRADEDSSAGSNLGWVRFASDTGIYYPYLATATTNTTLLASQTGTTVVFNNGTGTAANGTQYTLPAATVGMNFTIIGDVAKFFYVKPASGEIINYSTNLANNRISNKTTAAIGDSVSLFCIVAGQWSIKSRIGTWTSEGS